MRIPLRLKRALIRTSGKSPCEIIPHIFEHIENLASDPVPHHAHKITGTENLYRIRVGDYRVIYQVLHECHQVTVIYIRHRSVVYRGL
ncbi:MAG: type II toxin-antitoxin system mRNA interferase toxin, RelE/StbE family [Methanomicrobiales archaeon HGW-Methanomicrobiales-3]|nr:MAG: type II toxin-antitoxin system mRNA interferase toxin, RelE/StbE family [Methanomicrobiales archaeon HGW-Methanomicrobiales-3]